MSTVNITRVFRGEQETKYGLKAKVSIKTEEHGDKWLSTFNTAGTEAWTDGMEVNIDITEKGDFLNFKVPGGVATVPSASPAIEGRVAKLEEAVFGGQKETATKEETIQMEDTPEDDDSF